MRACPVRVINVILAILAFASRMDVQPVPAHSGVHAPQHGTLPYSRSGAPSYIGLLATSPLASRAAVTADLVDFSEDSSIVANNEDQVARAHCHLEEQN